LACFSGLAFPCLAGCEGGIAGVAGVAGLGAGGFADRAGTAGVARAGAPCVDVGAAGAGEVAGAGPLALGGMDGVLPAVPPLPGAGWPGAGVLGAGTIGVPPAGAMGPRTVAVAGGPVEMKTGVKLENGDGEAGGLVTACGRAGVTSAGTLRTWEPGTASSRIAEGSSTVKACIQSCADATAPAARAPT
jgi:hypothetical protein